MTVFDIIRISRDIKLMLSCVWTMFAAPGDTVFRTFELPGIGIVQVYRSRVGVSVDANTASNFAFITHILLAEGASWSPAHPSPKAPILFSTKKRKWLGICVKRVYTRGCQEWCTYGK